MNILKVSEFFEKETNPFLLGAFFGRYLLTKDEKYIVAISSFRKVKTNIPNFDLNKYYEEYTNQLNKQSKPNANWILKKEAKKLYKEIKLPRGNILYILENDLNLKGEDFFRKLYAKLIGFEWFGTDFLNEEKKSFMRAFMELRGSIDTKRNYITIDLYYSSKFELDERLIVPLHNMCVPSEEANINFRELQNEFYNSISERQTQFRLNLFWYMHNIGIINIYKAKKFMIETGISDNTIKDDVIYFPKKEIQHRDLNFVDNRLRFYSLIIFNKDLTKGEIKEFREKIGFDDMPKSIRDRSLVEFIKYSTPDECSGCKNDYNIEDRTFVSNKGKLRLDIHHMISLGKNKELDDLNNLVKLCPACHGALKRGSAPEKTQKDLISKIYINCPNVLEFAKNFFMIDDFDEIINLTFKHLK